MTVGDLDSDFQDPLEMEVSDACSPLSVSLLSPLQSILADFMLLLNWDDCKI
jgi:hypothetical protein